MANQDQLNILKPVGEAWNQPRALDLKGAALVQGRVRRVPISLGVIRM